MSRELHDDIVIGESCSSPRDDVDMGGTPTAAATIAMKEWRHILGSDDDREECRNSPNDQPKSTPQGTTAWPNPNAQHESARPQNASESRSVSATAKESEEVMSSFNEYNDDDIDDLDILPSQDFAGEGEHRIQPNTNQASLRPWHDYREGTQFQRDEESEVFDDVIYAPANTRSTESSRISTPQYTTSTIVDDEVVDSDSSLSDGFDIPPSIHRDGISLRASPRRSTPSPPTCTRTTDSAASEDSWHTRMSVKRDCSFVERSLEHRCPQAQDQEVADSSDEFEEKLKLVESESTASHHNQARCQARPSTRVPMPPPSSRPVISLGFRPKKKRRRVRQLGIDAFLQVQPSATY